MKINYQNKNSSSKKPYMNQMSKNNNLIYLYTFVVLTVIC